MPALTRFKEGAFPEAGLSIDPAGMAHIQNTGCGDQELVNLVVAATTFNTTPKFSSVIDIHACSQLLLLVDYVNVGSGPQAYLECQIQYSDKAASTWYTLLGGAISSGVITCVPLKFRKATVGKYVIPFPNPGAWNARIEYVGSHATATLTSVQMDVLRGWGYGNVIAG